MKTFLQRFNVIMFFIAFLTIQQYNSLEISSIFGPKTKIQDLENFEELCYYELKIDIIIKNYVTRIKGLVEKVFDKNAKQNRDKIKFSLFYNVFQTGHYGQIAPELAGSEDYVRSYWNYFKANHSETMTEKEFTKFMGLYFLEGQLLVSEIHPTLTQFFPNEHNVQKRVGCNVSIAFWSLSNELLQRMYIEFKYSTSNQKITKKEIFTIIKNTHTGKCLIMHDKKCPFFTKFVGDILGFFNMSAGSRDFLTTKETKVAFSTFIFSDIYDKECKQIKFDPEVLQTKIKAINLE